MMPRLYNESLGLWRKSAQARIARVFGVTDNFKKGFAAVCEQAGSEGFRFHGAGPTPITRVVGAGVAAMGLMKVSGYGR